MFNVKAAVSRLELGPKPKEMEVTDIRTGHFVFRPVAGKEVSYQALKRAIENAGYEIEDAAITVTGTVTDGRHLETPDGQIFELTAADAAGEARLDALDPGGETTLSGAWKAVEGVNVIVVAAGEDGPEQSESGAARRRDGP